VAVAYQQQASLRATKTPETLTITVQWIEVSHDGFRAARVARLLERHSVDLEAEQHLGLMYVRAPNSDWPTVCSLLDQDSVEAKYPLNRPCSGVDETVAEVGNATRLLFTRLAAGNVGRQSACGRTKRSGTVNILETYVASAGELARRRFSRFDPSRTTTSNSRLLSMSALAPGFLRGLAWC
jgi:hypothetical protein